MQENTDDCGIFAIKNALRWMTGGEVLRNLSRGAIKDFRMQTAGAMRAIKQESERQHLEAGINADGSNRRPGQQEHRGEESAKGEVRPH